MITALSLRAAYDGESEEFAHFDDAHLTAAISRAYSTMRRYVQAWPVAECLSALASLDEVALTLSRAYAHDEARFPDEDPVIREMREAIDWLKRVSDGRIKLACPEVVAATSTQSFFSGCAVIAPEQVFTGSSA